MHNGLGGWLRTYQEQVRRKMNMAEQMRRYGSYINYEALERMTDAEKDEMYNGLLHTFTGREAKP